MADWADELNENLLEAKEQKACCAAWIGSGDQETMISCSARDPQDKEEKKIMPYADEGGPWDEVWWESHEVQTKNADGEDVSLWVDEGAIYKEIKKRLQESQVVRTGNYPAGIWFGGKNYTVVQELELDGISYVLMAQKGEGKDGNAGGLTIAWNGYSIVCGMFKQPDQNKADCCNAVLEYARALKDRGF